MKLAGGCVLRVAALDGSHSHILPVGSKEGNVLREHGSTSLRQRQRQHSALLAGIDVSKSFGDDLDRNIVAQTRRSFLHSYHSI